MLRCTNLMRSTGAKSSAAAALALSATVLGRYSEGAMPAYFVLRPLAASLVLALLLGLLATLLLRRHAVLASVVCALGLAHWAWWIPWAPAIAAGAGTILLFRRLRRHAGYRTHMPIPGAVPSIAFSALLFTVSVAQALPPALDDIAPARPPASSSSASEGPNLYLVLLDGYPRGDTIDEEFGIRSSDFSDELAARGFDVYPQASTDHVWTELTLFGLLTGDEPYDEEGPVGVEAQRVIRSALKDPWLISRAWDLGYDLWVVDAPVGHVTFSAGYHIQPGGFNTFEDSLLRHSALAPAVDVFGPGLLAASLRGHIEASFQHLVELAQDDARRLVLVHILAPHPPFLWASDTSGLESPDYWPEVQLFESLQEITNTPAAEYSSAMRGQLLTLNRMVLRAVDEVLTRDPNGVVVLFSDHGARRTMDAKETEWKRVLLAGRTPGRPGLFAYDPRPEAILHALLRSYAPKPGE